MKRNVTDIKVSLPGFPGFFLEIEIGYFDFAQVNKIGEWNYKQLDNRTIEQ